MVNHRCRPVISQVQPFVVTVARVVQKASVNVVAKTHLAVAAATAVSGAVVAKAATTLHAPRQLAWNILGASHSKSWSISLPYLGNVEEQK